MIFSLFCIEKKEKKQNKFQQIKILMLIQEFVVSIFTKSRYIKFSSSKRKTQKQLIIDQKIIFDQLINMDKLYLTNQIYILFFFLKKVISLFIIHYQLFQSIKARIKARINAWINTRINGWINARINASINARINTKLISIYLKNIIADS
ncbi:hypothetical protein pb186bvf_014976 [Paramecium bursaria]